MSLAPLRIAAAGYVLECLSNEQLRQVADEALNRGVYTWRLGELATTTNPSYFVARPLFEKALKELAIPLPTERQAADAFLFFHLGRLLEGAESPAQGAAQVRKLADSWYSRAGLWAAFSTVEKGRLRRFEGFYWQYDEVTELSDSGLLMGHASTAELVPELDRGVLQLAAEWMTEILRGRDDPSWLTWHDGAIGKIAQSIRDRRQFLDLPLLADALEDAGCRDVEILEHCREQAPHVSSCWVVQLLLSEG